MSPLPKILSISLREEAPRLDAAEVTDHRPADERRGLGWPAPCLLFVADTGISEADIAREMQFHPAARPERSRADAARALVVRELLRRESDRLGVAGTAVDDAQAGRENVEEARIRLLLEQVLASRVPSEADCRRYFENNRERMRAADRIRVRHILLAVPDDDVAGRLTARRRGEALLAELRAQPQLFADFALRHSQCSSSAQGGELGWLQRGQTTPEFDRQIFRLRVGLAGFPLESRWGYHVVQVDDIERGGPLRLERARRSSG